MYRRQFFQASFAAAAAASLSSQATWASVYAALMKVGGNVDAITTDGKQTTLQQSAVQELSDHLRGGLLLPGNAAYETARRVLNPSIDKHPALIVQPSGPADISTAVNFARDSRLVVAVKCGGHSFSGKSTCNGGMMIDLSHFRNVRVDAAAQTAYVTGGSLLGQIDHEAMARGLVTTAGTVSHTGVGGLTTGGGFGRLARRYGLALDNVSAVDMVTADGHFRHASKDENQDLYWGVRGGGGNFGIVTSFEFKLHPMQRQVIGGQLVFPIERAHDLLEVYAEYASRAPDELNVDPLLGYSIGGKDGHASIDVCYSGPARDAEKALRPYRQLGKPLRDGIKPVDYVALQRSVDYSDPRTPASYLRSGFVTEFTPQLIDSILDGLEPHPQRSHRIYIAQAGGAIARVPVGATAFAHRYASCMVIAVTDWRHPAPGTEHMRYIKQYWQAIAPHTHGFYVNEIADEAATIVNKNYQGNFQRLVSIKNRYDPNNMFRLNANIAPTV
jgi:FAD/FMN-containing dehydrogenase